MEIEYKKVKMDLYSNYKDVRRFNDQFCQIIVYIVYKEHFIWVIKRKLISERNIKRFFMVDE